MTNDEEIIALLREIVENQRRAQAARGRAFRFANWITAVALAVLFGYLYWSTHYLK